MQAVSRSECVTLNGYFNFLAPWDYQFNIEEIATGLSRLARYTGLTTGDRFYSVAQHSWLVSYVVPESQALYGLLHDASEAYMGDIKTMIKDLFPEIKMLESLIMKSLYPAFGLNYPAPKEVKQADLIVLATERRDLIVEQKLRWPVLDNVAALSHQIEPWTEQEARERFLARYYELKGA